MSDSCGFSVPLMEHVGPRDTLDRWAAKRGPDGVAAYQRTRNAESIDGLPGLPAPAPGVPAPGVPAPEVSA